MNRTTVTRGLRVKIVMANGRRINQVFEITASDEAGCEAKAEFYVKGALSILGLLADDEILAVDINWAPVWDATKSLVSA